MSLRIATTSPSCLLSKSLFIFSRSFSIVPAAQNSYQIKAQSLINYFRMLMIIITISSSSSVGFFSVWFRLPALVYPSRFDILIVFDIKFNFWWLVVNKTQIALLYFRFNYFTFKFNIHIYIIIIIIIFFLNTYRYYIS